MGEVPARLVLLYLDAFDAELMRRWTAQGKLPAIRRLMEGGTSGHVQSPTGLYVGSSWASFYTGLNPASHGFYRFNQLAPGTYEFFRPLDHATGIGGRSIWTQASDAGLRVAAFDFVAPLDQDVNGIHVVGWGDFESRPYLEYATSPPGLAAEIFAAVGEYPRSEIADYPRRTVEEFAHLVASLELGIEKKTALTRELLDRDDWDLFMQVFQEPHCVGHLCWHLHDPASPAHDPQFATAIGDPLERVYCAIDRGVGSILERAGDARVLLFALHGMSSWRGADVLLDEILYRLGVTGRPPDSRVPQPDSQVPRLHEILYRLRVTDNPLYRRLRAHIGTNSASVSSYRHPANVFGWADVATSRCFRVPAGFPVSGIRLNLRGREPQGILNPGREADAFAEQLANDLLAIVDERTGSALVATVHRTDSLYAGERRDALPDLLVEWASTPTGTMAHGNGRGATVRARSEAIGVVEGTNGYHRTGEHVPTGFFVYTGPGIPVTERKQPVDVVDFYPTICSILGLPEPAVDGAVISELIAPR
jgi:predicted AlkP superfamily phosphohydrolase/phosphomutase